MVYYGGFIERETFRKGLFKTRENDMGWLWIQLSEISNVVFNIGANTGIYSLIAKSVNPDANIYAFEPSVNSFKKLELNNEINNFKIICEQLAAYLIKYKPIILEILDQTVATALSELISLQEFKLFHLKYNSKAERLKDFNIGNKTNLNGEWNYLLFHKDLDNKIRNFTSLYN